DLRLRVAVHHERDGGREGEERASVKGEKLLSLDLESRNHDRALRSRTGIAITRDPDRLRILEDGDIEIHRFFGIVVEPQERRDFLHGLMIRYRRPGTRVSVPCSGYRTAVCPGRRPSWS